MADNDYYRRLIDSDREETETTERQIKDDAGKILEETGADDPNKELFDDSNYVSPFEQATDMEKVRAMDMGREPQSTGAPVEDQGFVRDLLLGKQQAEIPQLQTPLAPPSGKISAAAIPRLSDIATSRKSVTNVPTPAAPTTAPTDISEQALANKMAGTDDYLGRNIEGASEYQNQMQKKYEAGFDANAVKAAAQYEALKIQQQKLQQQMDEADQAYREAQARAQKQVDSIGPIDPDRVWKNRATWSKMALILGAALKDNEGGDAGLKHIQTMIQNDLEAQKADLDKGIKTQGGLLSVLKPLADNKLNLMKMANDISVKMAQEYGDLLKQGVSRSAAPGMAIEKTLAYTKEMLALQNVNNKNLLTASAQQQKRKNDDNTWMQKNQEIQLNKARLKFDTQNLTESDAKRLEGATAMAISAKRMKELENDAQFDPTSVKYAISNYMQGKGIPSSLNEVESEYLSNYANYFSYKRQALTGAAASDKEEERIKLLVAPDKTFTKKSIKLYQKMRAKDINGAMNAMNPAALLRTKNIPEFREFDIDRGK